ncbi:ATP-binding protein [Paenibacillus herberti]|uniref:histidine kinase n=1 Tax=Paenibacillus herberti TaxID=1619309 RepID=A0A229P2G8_9BACL|nr:sensor histidine kinase [Paenibacillus herberti]OXM16251.1 histidine kinase [Paenibacillus herberti]
MRLQTKLIITICSLLGTLILALGGTFYYVVTRVVEQQIGVRALTVAESLAVMPEVRAAMSGPQPGRIIQPIAEIVRQKTNAEYVVVGDKEGIRVAHPEVEKIGKPMVGGDNGPVLAGKAIISKATGSMGLALRGKAPIMDDQGKVIGIVSVGFLASEIDRIDDPYQNKVFFVGTLVLLLGAAGAVWIARSVRRSIHGLEPREIGALYMEKEAILESIREGVVAVNVDGRITMANRIALDIMQLPEHEDLVGRPIEDILPNTGLPQVIRSGEVQLDQEMVMRGKDVVVNRVPILDNRGNVAGAVSSFRDKSELYRLAEELSQVKLFADSLRAQTHEFSNRLYVISGLIQLGSYKEAIELIHSEAGLQQNLIQFIMKEVPDPVLGGFLIGKFNHAREVQVNFTLDAESSFRDVPETIDRSLLVTIIGNLVDNGLDSVRARSSLAPEDRRVSLLLTDLGTDLIMECEDNGAGVPDGLGETIFHKGVSTKPGENRGIGLYLVHQAVTRLGGMVAFSRKPSGGTIFIAAVPKHYHSDS